MSYLRQRGLRQWDRLDSRRTELIARRPASLNDVAAWADWAEKNYGLDARDGQSGQKQERRSIQSTPSTKSIPNGASVHAEAMANGALALITVAVSLLNRQLAAQAAAFERDGGFTERLYTHRRAHQEP
jgi:four helix bundle suffix protein